MNFSDLTTVNHPFPKTRPEYLNFVEALNKKLNEDTNGQFRRKNGWLSSRIADALAQSSGVSELNINSLIAFLKQQDGKESSKKTPNTEQDLKEFIKRLDEQGSILVNGVECTNFHTPNLNTDNLLDDEAKFIFHVVDSLSTFLSSGEHLSPNVYYSVTQQNFLLGDLDKGVFTSDKGELKLEFIKEQSNLDKAVVKQEAKTNSLLNFAERLRMSTTPLLVNGYTCSAYSIPVKGQNTKDFIFSLNLDPNTLGSEQILLSPDEFLRGSVNGNTFTLGQNQLTVEITKGSETYIEEDTFSIDPQCSFTKVDEDFSIESTVPQGKFVNRYDDIFTNDIDPQGSLAPKATKSESIDGFIDKLLKQPSLIVNGNLCNDFYIPSSDLSNLTKEELEENSDYFIFRYNTPDHKSMEFILDSNDFNEGTLTLDANRYTSSNGKVVIQLIENAEGYAIGQICNCVTNDALHTHCERCDSSIELYDTSGDKNAEDVGYCDSCLNEYIYPSRSNVDEFAITKEGEVERRQAKLTFSNELHRLVFEDYALPVLTCSLNEIAEMLTDDTELTSDLLDEGFQDMVGDLANTAKNDHVAYKVLASYAASPERAEQFNRDYNTYVGNSNASIALMGDDNVRSELITTGCFMLRDEVQGVASNVLGAIETMYSEEPEHPFIVAIENGDRSEAIAGLSKLMGSMVANFDVF